MQGAYYLALSVGHAELTPDGHYFTWRNNLSDIIGEDNHDIVTAWADGLMHKYYENVSTGHCSLSQTINFDLERFETKVKIQIHMMTDALKTLGKPIKLTPEIMKARGYK